MTRTVRTTLMAAGFIGMLSVGQASAQLENTVIFTTTFPFTVGHTTVPAGRYTIRQANDQDSVLELTSTSGHLAVFFVTENLLAPTEVARQTEVVFDHDGDQYWLKDVWVEGDETGAEAMSAQAVEKELTKRVAGNKPAFEELHVAAMLRGKAQTSRAAARSS